MEVKFKIIDVSCGMTHTLFLSENKDVYVLGVGKHGELGLGKDILTTDILVKIDIKDKEGKKDKEDKEGKEDKEDKENINNKFNTVKEVYSFIRTSFILFDNGDMYCFGSNRNNELGFLNENDILDKEKKKLYLKDYFVPVKNNLVSNSVIDIKSCFKHTILVIKENELDVKYLGCGNNSKGALGLNTSNYESSVGLLNLSLYWKIDNIIDIKVSWNNTILLTSILIFLINLR